ncbi:MAG: hypothetical protein RSP_11970 [Rhodanobacter sp.]
MTQSRRPLTSLLLVEERLLEAEYFTGLMRRRGGAEFGYCLNAFVSASRSVTFLIQKEMARVSGFDAWWSGQQKAMSRDPAMRFFLELRNYSQKEGRISLVGVRRGHGSSRRWSHCFAGTEDQVPDSLLHRDVTDCCREHLAKLAQVVIACTERFPFHACPRMALTPEGMQALGLSVDDLGMLVGLDPSWVRTAELPLEDLLRILRAQVDGLDTRELGRLARWTPRRTGCNGAADPFGEELQRRLVDQLEGPERQADTFALLAEMLLRN